jgi:hypothetical protein
MLICKGYELTSDGEHGAGGVRAPHDRKDRNNIAKETVQRYDDTQS